MELCIALPSAVLMLVESFFLSQVGWFVKIDYNAFSLMRMFMYNSFIGGCQGKTTASTIRDKTFPMQVPLYIFLANVEIHGLSHIHMLSLSFISKYMIQSR